MEHINIAVDGHSASGKSSICTEVAKKLNINHLSSGGIFRAIALYVLENNFDYEKYVNNNEETFKLIKKELENCNIKVKFNNFSQIILLNNQDVTNKLHISLISNVASIISQNLIVREFVKNIQQYLAKTQDIIMDGRDTTSDILKDCKYKFFITASVDVRAERRYLQYGKKIPLEKIKQELIERDYRDEHREIGTLKFVEDAILIDTSNLTIEETVDKMLSYIS